MGIPTDRKPDAILSPSPKSISGFQKQHWFRDKLAPLVKKVPGDDIGTKLQGLASFIAPGTATLVYPVLHPLAGRERYDWYVVALDTDLSWEANPVKVEGYGSMMDSVKFGYLKDEATVIPPGLDEKVDFLRFVERRNAAYEQTARRIKELAENKGRTPEEDEELSRLAGSIQDIANATFAGFGGDEGILDKPSFMP